MRSSKLTGGVDGGRGCKGDVKNMLLDMARSNPRKKTQTSQPVVAVIPMPVANKTQVSV